MDADTVVLMAAQASRMENQDAIDAAIVGTLADPKEVQRSLSNSLVCSKMKTVIYIMKLS